MSFSSIPTDPNNELEQYVMRFANIKATVGAPPDARLPEFQRERFPVVGRPEERRPGDPQSLTTGANVNIMYLRCEPGMGFSLHKHDDWEMFIPMTGKWQITCGDQRKIILGPWDAMLMPGDIYHDAKNVSESPAFMMGINPGNRQAKFTVHPSVVARLTELDSR
jgi:mannose-6-phosphate isomerase-like protein (cupin superfamily)